MAKPLQLSWVVDRPGIGNYRTRSSRWETREQAEEYAASVRSINPKEKGEYWIVPVKASPEFFKHCRESRWPVNVGHKCPCCQERADQNDAIEAGAKERARTKNPQRYLYVDPVK